MADGGDAGGQFRAAIGRRRWSSRAVRSSWRRAPARTSGCRCRHCRTPHRGGRAHRYAAPDKRMTVAWERMRRQLIGHQEQDVVSPRHGLLRPTADDQTTSIAARHDRCELDLFRQRWQLIGKRRQFCHLECCMIAKLLLPLPCSRAHLPCGCPGGPRCRPEGGQDATERIAAGAPAQWHSGRHNGHGRGVTAVDRAQRVMSTTRTRQRRCHMPSTGSSDGSTRCSTERERAAAGCFTSGERAQHSECGTAVADNRSGFGKEDDAMRRLFAHSCFSSCWRAAPGPASRRSRPAPTKSATDGAAACRAVGGGEDRRGMSSGIRRFRSCGTNAADPQLQHAVRGVHRQGLAAARQPA